MHLDNWRLELETALVAALKRAQQLDLEMGVRRLDIGVFPWYGLIELSLLRTTDQAEDAFGHTGIADWPLYDFSWLTEGRWPEAVRLAQVMQTTWERDPDSAESFFQTTAIAASSSNVKIALDALPLSADFIVTVYNPDNHDSRNYLT